MSCHYADRDGSYVLGALSPAERLEFEQHLAGCADCARAVRELAGLPGLLARVDPAVVEDPPREEPVPDTLLPPLLYAVRRTRRRRAVVTAGLAAAAVAVVVAPLVVSGSVGGDGTRTATPPPSSSAAAAPTGRAMASVGDAPVHAKVSFASVAWGTRLDLTCTYAPGAEGYHLPPAMTYSLFVRTRDGSTQQVGTWRAIDGRTMRLTAATATARRDIASVEVRTADGHPVLKLTT